MCECVLKVPGHVFNMLRDHLQEKMLCTEMHCNSDCPHWTYGREGCREKTCLKGFIRVSKQHCLQSKDPVLPPPATLLHSFKIQ